jgi:hypothetical protein
MNEAEWSKQVVSVAHQLGYRSVHQRPCREGRSGKWTTPTTIKGWPDWTFIRPPRLVFAELKGDTTPMRPGQQEMLDLLAACGEAEAYLWRSGAITLQAIAEVLASRTVRRVV